ncbi:excisionase [Sphingomonas segetis]|jgi:hypothetical protein|uniref:excisionase n=1 Tax=Sphingomonas segetis TaxID=1104779 RepID=UPI0012D2E373|nr:excisionase [Sphingomonas segetis]
MIEDPVVAAPRVPLPITVRIPEACRLKLYELISAGEIEIVKVGTITLAPVTCLMGLIERHAR